MHTPPRRNRWLRQAKCLGIALACIWGQSLVGAEATNQDGVWTKVPSTSNSQAAVIDGTHSMAHLDRTVLEQVLGAARTGSDGIVLRLPMPDGTFTAFAIEAVPLAEPGLDEKSGIHAFRGVGVDDAALAARIEWSPAGLHAVISGGEAVVHVDPATNDPSRVIAYSAANAKRPRLDGGNLPLAAVRQIESLMGEKASRGAGARKISSALLDARHALDGAEAALGVRLPAPALDMDDRGLVLVDVTADVSPALLDRIGALGGTVVDSVPSYRAIRARLPLDALEALAAEAAVERIAPAARAVTNRKRGRPRGASRRQATIRRALAAKAASLGETSASNNEIKENTSQGDKAHQADVARATHAVDGTGVGIGVLSDGIQTLADRQATGDAPMHVAVLPGQAGIGDEGTAMLEIVHDLAPGAHLYYATAFTGAARFAANIEALCAAGADVIVDDIFYFDEGAFQDDIIARGVNAAVANGCFYFSAAGNSGNLNDGTSGVWEGDFSPAADGVDGVDGVVHDFGNGANSNRITEPGLATDLQWADPLGAATNDYDLYLFDETLTTVVARSANPQSAEESGAQPKEMVFASGVGNRIVVVQTTGEPRFLRVSALRGQLEHGTSGQTVGHSAADNAVGVAAVDVESAGESGVFDGDEPVETFSSDGPRRMFFEPDGTPVTPGDFSATGGQTLAKPDITGADGVATATPGFHDFHGTSAAAPHIAAIAALMVQAAGGRNRISFVELRSALAAVALDIEAPGFDRDSGAGIPLAPAAVAAVQSATVHDAPTIAQDIERQELLSYAQPTVVELSQAFDDANGNALSYAVLSSDPNVAAAELTGTRLTITPGIRGSATLLVRATEAGGLSTILTIEVRVDRIWGSQDYDADADGLIEVATLEQLDAIRHDLNGDSIEDQPTEAYFAAFPNAMRDMGCPLSGCGGYELVANLDFESASSYASGRVNSAWIADGAGVGWEPIGLESPGYGAIFEGNNHTIANLFVNSDQRYAGLFGYVANRNVGSVFVMAGPIRNIGLVDVQVTANSGINVGALAGYANAPINNAFATGQIRAGGAVVGGLVGYSHDLVAGSWAACSTYGSLVGGLVGQSQSGGVVASYATGRVTGYRVGGLVGELAGSVVRGNYFAGRVFRLPGGSSSGALVGSVERGDFGVRPIISASYWDLEASGLSVAIGTYDRDGATAPDAVAAASMFGKTTAELYAPTEATGLYSQWEDYPLKYDESPLERPWHFGGADQYPILRHSAGRQLRQRPELTMEVANGSALLTWTAPSANAWPSPPVLRYTVYRDGETLAKDIAGTAYTDMARPEAADAPKYQVAVTVNGMERLLSNIAPNPNLARPPATGTDYDTDNDGLIEISSLGQLHAIRHDPNGDGIVDREAGRSPHDIAFPTAMAGMGCPSGCEGYELVTDLDFDSNGTGTHDAGDEYWNGGSGWMPLGTDFFAWGLCVGGADSQSDAFSAIFEGNDRAISNLQLNREGEAGLFAGLCRKDYRRGEVRNLRLANVDVSAESSGALTPIAVAMPISRVTATGKVSGNRSVGGLIGTTSAGAAIAKASFGGQVSATGIRAGGLIGYISARRGHRTVVEASHARGIVTGTDAVGGLIGRNESGSVRLSWTDSTTEGADMVGGLVGENRNWSENLRATIAASYAKGTVKALTGANVGGLVGVHDGGISASYAANEVEGSHPGGLVGSNLGTILASYAERNGIPAVASGESQGARILTAAELRQPIDYVDVFTDWNVDLDGDGEPDDPWDFGTADDYPALKADWNDDGRRTWEEFALQQRRAISPQELDEAATLDLRTIFGHRDGQVFEASSSNPAVVTVSVAGGLLTLAPNEAGEATVTVTVAFDGATSTVTFLVDVGSGQPARSWRWTILAEGEHPPVAPPE